MAIGIVIPACRCSRTVAGLAYVALAYLCTSIIYIVVSRCVGTPFRDSLTDEQLEIMKKSKKTRGCIALVGLLVSICILVAFRPLR